MSENTLGRVVDRLLGRRELRLLPVHPDLKHLRRQAKELLRAVCDGNATAIAHFEYWHPASPKANNAKLADAQLSLAQRSGATSGRASCSHAS